MQFTITVDDLTANGITAARLAHNKSLPQTVQVPDPTFVAPAGDPTAKAPLVAMPNPALFTTDAAYVQQRWGVDAAKSYYESLVHTFRFPTGDWLQRWTAAEKKKIRDMGAGKVAGITAAEAANVQALLDRIDASPLIHMFEPDVVNGVPFVCGLLEKVGTLPVGSAAAKAAEIRALKL